jgi:Restriction endonuclease
VILEIHDYFADPHDFEACAAAIWRLHAERIEYTMTRPSRDGGRDAIGELRVGPESDPVRLDFVLEAKCYDMGHAVGVRELSRLISRIRNRMFGVLVTTSYLHEQAYQELKADGHPIVVIAARDIVEILRAKGYGDVPAVRAWLEREFPQRPVEVVSAPPYDLITSS